MIEEKRIFLDTRISQIEVANVLLEKLKDSLEYLTYNIKRYNVPVVMVMFYTCQDIGEKLEADKRLTDLLISVKIGKSYFNIVFLPFTELLESYNFIKHVEYDELNSTENFYHHELLPAEINNYFNFINGFLFTLEEKSKQKN